MFEGGTSKTHGLIKKKIKTEREDFKKLLDLITDIFNSIFEEQIINGVDIVKIFESWAGLLSKDDYNDFIIEPNKKIQKAIKQSYPKIPLIFSKGNQRKRF